MRDQQLHRARMISSVAATAIALGCGSNYVYSAWAPQFADKLKYSTTQSNLVGLAGNLGMYSLGVPIGLFIDAKGPRPAVLIGSAMLGLGYFPLRLAYDSGSGPIPLVCLFSCLTGLGGCMAFAGAIKTSALNWPHHRGTATAFPLAAFGLSAFVFSVVGGVLFPGDTSGFLMLLACGTFGMTLLGFFFLKVIPHGAYAPLAEGDDDQPRRRGSLEAKSRRGVVDVEPGRSTTTTTTINSSETHPTPPGAEEYGLRLLLYVDGTATAAASKHAPAERSHPATASSSTITPGADDLDADETSSLVSTTSSLPGDVYVQDNIDMEHRSHRVDTRGWALLRNAEFWQLFSVMGILAGVGLMTINNIGHSAVALWQHYDDSIGKDALIQRQQLHVSILSVCSFSGRLLSGVGSDFLVKAMRASRIWCIVVAGLVFLAAQVCALGLVNPHLLGLVSGLSGLGYGLLFGGFPSIVAESFGIHGLSQNWGLMTLSPVVSGNVFNLLYGVVFDRHSVVGPDGERSCADGVDCYRAAYHVTLGACGLGFVVALWAIRSQSLLRPREAKKTKAIAED